MELFLEDVLTTLGILLHEKSAIWTLHNSKFFGLLMCHHLFDCTKFCGRWCKAGNIVNLLWEVGIMTSCTSKFGVLQEYMGNFFTFSIPIQRKRSHKYSLKCYHLFPMLAMTYF